MPEQREGRNPLERFVITVKNVFETPVEWFRGIKEAPTLFLYLHSFIQSGKQLKIICLRWCDLRILMQPRIYAII